MAKRETPATEEQDRRRRRGSSVPSGKMPDMKVPAVKKKAGKRMPKPEIPGVKMQPAKRMPS